LHLTEPADITFSTQQDSYQSRVVVKWSLMGNAMGFDLSYQNASSTIDVRISVCNLVTSFHCIQQMYSKAERIV